MWLTTLPAFAKKFGEQLGYFNYVSMMGEALEGLTGQSILPEFKRIGKISC